MCSWWSAECSSCLGYSVFAAMSFCWGVIREEAESTAVGGSNAALPHSGGTSLTDHMWTPTLPSPFTVELRGLGETVVIS